MTAVDLSVHPRKGDDLLPRILVRRWASKSKPYVTVKVALDGQEVAYFFSYEQYEEFRTAMNAGLDPANEEAH